ncbi:MAG: hypothetical protein E7468_06540 [Ruminococcaceae bacterium]|nr:hypothetical protein [Oscillospiraceae bacterium]
MEFLLILLIGAATFAVCFLLDKVFTGVFRGKPQHRSGQSVRLSQHYGGAGVVLALLGLLAVFQSAGSSLLLICGSFVILLGVALIVYYLTFGVYYDADSLIVTTFGKKSKVYSYADIRAQKLYRITGGNVVIELYFTDGRTVALQSNMKGVYPFLDTAFAGWCNQKNVDKENCPFHDPANSCWFPSVEE